MDSDSKIGTVADLIADYPSRQRKVENDFSEVVVPEMSDRAKASFESLGLLDDVRWYVGSCVMRRRNQRSMC